MEIYVQWVIVPLKLGIEFDFSMAFSISLLSLFWGDFDAALCSLLSPTRQCL